MLDSRFLELPTEFYKYLEETGKRIAEAMGPRVDYCASMDLDILPEIVVFTFPNTKRIKWIAEKNITKKDLVDDMHFLARSNDFLPESLSEANFGELRYYIKKNKKRLFGRINKIFQSYCAEYGC